MRPHDQSDPELPTGTRLGPYVVERLVGAGGMGQVYRARDERLDRAVAIKLLPARFSDDPNRLRRFEQEARLAGSLSHPNILGIYDVGRHGSSPFIVTELLVGQTLRDRLRGRYLTPARALEIARQLLAGLAAAHAKGIIHRDLKPSNVFLCADGPVKILDFGVAKLVLRDPQTGEPMTGWTTEALPGTVGYLAPEQAHGRRIDHRVDIFAFGCVLYEMLSGRKAFAGSTPAEVLVATLSSEPPELDRVASDVPHSLARVAHCCLEKEPDDRYSTVHDLRLALDAAEEQLARPRWLRRKRFRRLSVRAAGLVGAVVVAALAVNGVVGRLRSSSLPAFEPRPVTSGAGLEEHPALSPDGGFIAYAATEAGNTDIWLTDVRGGIPLRLTTHEALDDLPAWFPDGSSLLFVSDRGGGTGVWRVPRLGGEPTSLLPNAGDPAVSPDGTRLAFTQPDATGYRRVLVAPLDDLQTARVLSAREHGLWDHERPVWSPDGRTICYHAQNHLWLVDANGGTPRRLATGGEADVQPAWSPDGHFLYFSSIRNGIRAIWRQPVRGGVAERLTMGPEEKWPSVAGDGRRLAYATLSERRSLAVIDTTTAHRVEFEQTPFIGLPAVAPDGSAVVFVSDRDNAVDLWRLPLGDGGPVGEPRRLTDQPGRVSWPNFSVDGRWIAYYRVVDGQRDIWTVPAAGGASRQFTDDQALDVSPVWSPDGSELAFLSDRGGSEQIWVAAVREGQRTGEARPLTDSATSVHGFTWSPDGTEVAYVAPVEGVNEVWLQALDGEREARPLTTGAGALDLRWPHDGGGLVVQGLWGRSVPSLRTVDPATGQATPLALEVAEGPTSEIADFDVSPGGRWLAVVEVDRRGDVWLLEASKGSF
ncbi:MAG: serine/threonine-protein kinase [Acidobacteria bacterium]|nr:serine/threonine-protein kinase [Acidobacteriota bacterium]